MCAQGVCVCVCVCVVIYFNIYIGNLITNINIERNRIFGTY